MGIVWGLELAQNMCTTYFMLRKESAVIWGTGERGNFFIQWGGFFSPPPKKKTCFCTPPPPDHPITSRMYQSNWFPQHHKQTEKSYVPLDSTAYHVNPVLSMLDFSWSTIA